MAVAWFPRSTALGRFSFDAMAAIGRCIATIDVEGRFRPYRGISGLVENTVDRALMTQSDRPM